MKTKIPLLSIVIPAYNEEENVLPFHKVLSRELAKIKDMDFEILYVNDGSTDATLKKVHSLANKDKRIRIVSFSRNFGKESATTAGLQFARGNAIITLDADGQHPPELISKFINKWRTGAQVIVGVRKKNQKEGFVKRYGSKVFYKFFNSTEAKITPGSTDFTLIDRVVQQQFNKLKERNRMTRGLIDWVGYKRDTIEFVANPRMAGEATYDVSKLVQLALNSFVSMSLKPLYLSGYAGLFIVPLSLLLGLLVIVEQLVLRDPLGWKLTGTAMLGILLVFLVGLLLISQGITALYISRIHIESQDRPLFIVNEEESLGL